ncbi:hypothetical protein BC826DRAFT_975758 [Russula brevipes]|nr:hypothetical protein BC826DRAFT_975758 [Russula brevipes]
MSTSPPTTTAHGELRPVIELKSLRVLDKQRALRTMVAERLTHSSLLLLNRSGVHRVCKPAMRDMRMTENLERKQHMDCERRAKQKHVEQLGIICTHGPCYPPWQSCPLIPHLAEREEQKRIMRVSEECLKALKADDEEAYMKFIDTTKDSDSLPHCLDNQGPTLSSPPCCFCAPSLAAESLHSYRQCHPAHAWGKTQSSSTKDKPKKASWHGRSGFSSPSSR